MEASAHTKPMVINLGLGRTGTLSFTEAMNILGFGPCYHMMVLLQAKGKDIPSWWKLHYNDDAVETLRTILSDYGSAADYPIALSPEICLAAYPDAKFVLNVRPAEQWKRSVETTILRAKRLLYFPSFFTSTGWMMYTWINTILWQGQFEGRFHQNAVDKFHEHTEHVKRVIPPDQLLIFEVGEGWERLCQFLDVPIPKEAFPHSNGSESFTNLMWTRLRWGMWLMLVIETAFWRVFGRFTRKSKHV
ncbi:P-loop containing nucleoside triphosphate hydrolase protein [Flagelloscypha sp. PMI_526]|nr:P-loop containing nucleoside triphosphate hydrolase protein [Flagelloscypha sp. PMI_526]